MEKKVDLIHNPLCSGKWSNKPCVCGSGKKTKKCHGQYRAIPIEMKRDLDNILPEYKNLLDMKKILNKEVNNE